MRITSASIISVLLLFSSCREYPVYTPSVFSGIKYKTDRDVYLHGETVNITFNNSTSDFYYTFADGYRSVEINTDTGWTTVAAIFCNPDCPISKVGIRDSISGSFNLQGLSGTFRAFTYYGLTITSVTQPLFSNEFIINP